MPLWTPDYLSVDSGLEVHWFVLQDIAVMTRVHSLHFFFSSDLSSWPDPYRLAAFYSQILEGHGSGWPS